MWEEPCISGVEGSGTVFFTGCNLKCVYCQNKAISKNPADNLHIYVTPKELSDIFLKLQDIGANNINLVTPSHYYLQIKQALEIAKPKLHIPVLANTSSYDSVETLKEMDGLIDIYLADYKYHTAELSQKYSKAYDYPEVARAAIAEMYRQVGPASFNEKGLMTKGIIVRNLLLPGHVKESQKCIEYIYNTYGDNVYVSIMNQYTPFEIPDEFPELNRKTTKREYNRLLDFCFELGIKNAFIQEGAVAMQSFIPDWGIYVN